MRLSGTESFKQLLQLLLHKVPKRILQPPIQKKEALIWLKRRGTISDLEPRTYWRELWWFGWVLSWRWKQTCHKGAFRSTQKCLMFSNNVVLVLVQELFCLISDLNIMSSLSACIFKTKTITSCFLGLNFMTYTSLKRKDTNKAYLHHQRNGKLWSHYAIILVWWSDYDFWMSGIAFGQMSHALILETYYRTHNLAISQPNSLFINFYGMI